MKTRKLKYRAVWIVSTCRNCDQVIVTQPTTYSIAHRLLTAASIRGRTGWVEEVLR